MSRSRRKYSVLAHIPSRQYFRDKEASLCQIGHLSSPLLSRSRLAASTRARSKSLPDRLSLQDIQTLTHINKSSSSPPGLHTKRGLAQVHQGLHLSQQRTAVGGLQVDASNCCDPFIVSKKASNTGLFAEPVSSALTLCAASLCC